MFLFEIQSFLEFSVLRFVHFIGLKYMLSVNLVKIDTVHKILRMKTRKFVQGKIHEGTFLGENLKDIVLSLI